MAARNLLRGRRGLFTTLACLGLLQRSLFDGVPGLMLGTAFTHLTYRVVR